MTARFLSNFNEKRPVIDRPYRRHRMLMAPISPLPAAKTKKPPVSETIRKIECPEPGGALPATWTSTTATGIRSPVSPFSPAARQWRPSLRHPRLLPGCCICSLMNFRDSSEPLRGVRKKALYRSLQLGWVRPDIVQRHVWLRDRPHFRILYPARLGTIRNRFRPWILYVSKSSWSIVRIRLRDSRSAMRTSDMQCPRDQKRSGDREQVQNCSLFPLLKNWRSSNVVSGSLW